MKQIEVSHKAIKRKYDIGLSPLEEIREITVLALLKLGVTGTVSYTHGSKIYTSFQQGINLSRPILTSLFIRDADDFRRLWDLFIASIDGECHISTMVANDIDRVLYTSVMSFAACYDIWKPKSRKTPGTHFELLLGSVLAQFMPELARTKFIALPGQDEKVSTDIVFGSEIGGLVIPAKITTRERIVQPYAHQRILDSVFPDGRYKSVLMCVSETQRDDDNTKVNDICVPGTVRLFQTHLASLSGIYYIDPPARYLHQDVAAVVRVSTYSALLREDLPKLIGFTTRRLPEDHLRTWPLREDLEKL